jgi:hypothetical protein
MISDVVGSGSRNRRCRGGRLLLFIDPRADGGILQKLQQLLNLWWRRARGRCRLGFRF